MSSRSEVIVSSDSSGVLWTACIWDSQTGTALMNYKGGGTAKSHCMSFVGNDYILCAEESKPLIHVWPLNSQEISRSIERIITPGCLSALCVSPSNDYCVFACGEKIYIWDLMRGQLLPVITRHFRAITCLKFTDDGSHLISCGQDGMVVVWPLAYLVSSHASEFLIQMEAGQPEPRYTFSDHSLPVTDLYVGHGGIQALIATVSGDHTCKIYSLADGNLILSVVFNSALSAVTMNVNELEVFIGSVNGDIYHFEMHRMPRTLEYHVTKDEMVQKFVGHSKAVTSLSASLDGYRLVSGSMDGTVIVWDIKSKQCMKVLQHKGPISNAFITLCPKHVFSNDLRPSLVVQNFKKKTGKEEELVRFIRKDGFITREVNRTNAVSSAPQSVDKSQCDNLEAEVVKLKEVNKKLYKFAVDNIFLNQEDLQ